MFRIPVKPRQRIAVAVAVAILLVGAAALVARRDQRGGVRTTGTTTTSTTTSSTVGPTTTTTEATTTTAPTTTTPSTTTASTIGPGDTSPLTEPAPGPPAPTTGFAAITLVPVAALTDPIAAAAVPGQPGVLYIATRAGRVYLLRGSSVSGPVLDLSAETDETGEHGLLGITLTPDGSRLVFSYTDLAGNSRVEIATLDGNGVVDTTTRQVLFAQQQPAGRTNHKGGNVAFGPDGALWFGLGDGGGAGDPDGNAQNLSTYLGKLLRIDLNSGRGSIVDWGLRNPWRWSFDRATGDLWIGDVGQNLYEEIDWLPAGVEGANFAWNRREGFHSYNGGALLPGDTQPVWEYGHNPRCAVTGGYVYRGSAIPGLYGAYLFSDLCGGDIRALRLNNGSVTEERSLGVSASSVVSFGEDAAGELYVLSFDGHVYAVMPA